MEIQQLMQCPSTGNEEGLVGYWNLKKVKELRLMTYVEMEMMEQ